MLSLIGLGSEIKNRDVVIVEDIVDSGNTLKKFIATLEERNPRSISVATLFYKPDAVKHELPLNYIGMSIPNDFVIGYGLDYNGLGRSLRHLYSLAEDNE